MNCDPANCERCKELAALEMLLNYAKACADDIGAKALQDAIDTACKEAQGTSNCPDTLDCPNLVRYLN